MDLDEECLEKIAWKIYSLKEEVTSRKSRMQVRLAEVRTLEQQVKTGKENLRLSICPRLAEVEASKEAALEKSENLVDGCSESNVEEAKDAFNLEAARTEEGMLREATRKIRNDGLKLY